MLDHLGGGVEALFHLVNLTQIGDQLITGALFTFVSGNIQPDQVFVGIQRDGRVCKAHQIAIFFVVEEGHFIAFFQRVGAQFLECL